MEWSDALIILSPLVIILATLFLGHVLNTLLKKTFERIQRAMKGRGRSKYEIQEERTRFAVIRRLLVASVYILGGVLIVISIPSLRTLSYSLFAGAGIVAIIIGFATQKALSNIIAGIFIAIFEPFTVGDRIKIEKSLGNVEDITLNHTVVKLTDNTRLVIPNSQITESKILNYSMDDEIIRTEIYFSISYDSDIDLALKIMVDEVLKHKTFKEYVKQYKNIDWKESVYARVEDLSEYFIKLRLFFNTPDQGTGWMMSTDLRKNIKKRFDKAGIEIPFPYRTLVYKKDMKKPKQRR